MSKILDKAEVERCVMTWPKLYETEDGSKFQGAPVSEVPARLRDNGWKNVSRFDEFDLKKMGVKIVTARYVGGVRPKRFCRVVVATGG